MAKKTITEYKLDYNGVDQISKTLVTWMEDLKVPASSIIRSRLITESLLVDVFEHYGESKDVEVCLTKRFGRNSCTITYEGFPHGTSGKEHTCQCRRHNIHEFSPWVGKILWRRA